MNYFWQIGHSDLSFDVLVAREEIRLVEMAMMRGIRTRIGVNADLCSVFPHRSMDSIKGLRNNEKYQWLRSRHEEQGREVPPTKPPGSPIRDFDIEANKERKWTTPEPKDRTGPNVRWRSKLLDEVARREARLSLVLLSELFPERTLESIKGMLRIPKYKLWLNSFCRMIIFAAPHQRWTDLSLSKEVKQDASQTALFDDMLEDDMRIEEMTVKLTSEKGIMG